MERSKAYQMKTLRLQERELRIIDHACAALHGLDRASLISDAVLFEATRLGVRYSTEPLEPLKKSWPYLPDRGNERTEVRHTITLDITILELVARAAEHVHASEPLFIIGSALAYIGRLQRCYRGLVAETPEEAAQIRKKLQAIKLPSQYEYRRSSS